LEDDLLCLRQAGVGVTDKGAAGRVPRDGEHSLTRARRQVGLSQAMHLMENWAC
jgi:hypothetical protein